MSGAAPTSSDWRDAPIDELYAQLGELLIGQSLGVGPRGRRNVIREGEQWLDKHLTRLSAVLCGHPVLEPLRGDNSGDLSDLVLLLPAFAKPSDAFGFVVAALIVRRGVSRLCDDSS